jgi:dTDP-4-amino-4,6-dideoxygalactose transaminase
VTKDFEAALCEYTGAPYAVAVNSCTMALTLAVAWHLRHEYPGWVVEHEITIPKRTYVSVPQAIIHAGGRPVFDDREWLGYYQLKPLPVFDCARWFSEDMYSADPPWRDGGGYDGNMLCVSFHASKTLGLEQGGAILHDNPEADAWFRRARFDGRAEGVAPKDDTGIIVGWHAYMNPSTAAQGILKLHSLPRHNEPLPNDDYPDLSILDIFR